jgi:cytochrome P450
MCLGMNFANAELFIGLASLFRRVDLELFETSRGAVDMAADYFVPIPRADTKG